MYIELLWGLGRGSEKRTLRHLFKAVAPLVLACTAVGCHAEPAVPAGYALVPVAAVSRINPAEDCTQPAPVGSRPNCLHRYWTGSVCVVGDRYAGCPCYEGRRCTNGHRCRVVAPDKCTCD